EIDCSKSFRVQYLLLLRAQLITGVAHILGHLLKAVGLIFLLVEGIAHIADGIRDRAPAAEVPRFPPQRVALALEPHDLRVPALRLRQWRQAASRHRGFR